MSDHLTQIRAENWRALRHEQFYEKRLIIIRLPNWLARIRRALTGGYGPKRWKFDND